MHYSNLVYVCHDFLIKRVFRKKTLVKVEFTRVEVDGDCTMLMIHVATRPAFDGHNLNHYLLVKLGISYINLRLEELFFTTPLNLTTIAEVSFRK